MKQIDLTGTTVTNTVADTVTNTSDITILPAVTPIIKTLPVLTPEQAVLLNAFVDKVFGIEGLLVKSGKLYREPQHKLALSIAQCFIAGKPGMMEGAVGVGKCLGRGTPVLKYDGKIVPVESVVAGDLLMGPDSKPRRVLVTSTGTGPLFRITPVKGDSWVCNDVHVLTLRLTGTNKVFDMPLDELLKKGKSFQREVKLFQPDGGVDFPERNDDLPVSPYFLGIWLGDGTKCLLSVGVTKPDIEIRDACQAEADRFGLRLVENTSSTGCPAWKISGEMYNKSNPLLNSLRELMSDGVRIPDAYLFGSREVRSQVLAGLLDTDGYLLSPGGGYEIVQRNKRVADGITFLARSLGFRVNYSEKIVNDTVYYRLNLSGDSTHLPMRIPRKKAAPRQQIKNALVTGFTTESIGDGEYFGFTLDGDGRFLLGDFTVTHNTYAYLVCAIWVAANLHRRTIIAVSTNSLLEQIFKDIPDLMSLTGVYATYGQLKGRANYVCQNARDESMDQMLKGRLRVSYDDRDAAEKLIMWADKGTDLTHYSDSLSPSITRLVSIDGQGCKNRRDNCNYTISRDDNGRIDMDMRCNFSLARRSAVDSSIVVTNLNLMLLNNDMDQVIFGKFDYSILDEAHEVNAKVRDHYSEETSLNVFDKAAKHINETLNLPRVAEKLLNAADAMRQSMVKYAIRNEPAGTKTPDIEVLVRRGGDTSAMVQAATHLQAMAVEAKDAGVKAKDRPTSIDEAARSDVTAQAKELFEAASFTNDNDAIGIVVKEKTDPNTRPKMTRVPVDVSGLMKANIHANSLVIAISATLTPDGKHWTYPRKQLAMPEDALTMSVESPFDYQKCSIVYVPSDMPQSWQRDAYNTAASSEAGQIVQAVGGRTLILCSARADMEVARKAITGLGYNVYMQDQAPPKQLAKLFKDDPTSCLIGSKTFGTGFDVPGDALQCVILWKLPFAKQSLVDEYLKKTMDGGEGAWHGAYYEPAMLLDLKQWAGRLIRRQGDIGVIAILDGAKVAKLRRRVMGALPKGAPLAKNIKEVEEFLRTARSVSGTRSDTQRSIGENKT